MPTKGQRPSGLTPEPPPDRDAHGIATTGAVRLRAGLFGFAIAEEQVEDSFGTRFWRRIRFPILLGSSFAQRRT